MQVPQGSIYWPQAQPGRRGLLMAAAGVAWGDLVDYETDNALEWVNGFSYYSDSCDAADPMQIRCLGSPADKIPVDNPDAVPYRPFLTFGTDRCSTMDNARPRQARARRNLIATESWQIEREFFDGVATIDNAGETLSDVPNPFMTDGATAVDVTGATPLGPMHALARIEAELMSCLHGQRTMIHATPDLVTLWNAGGGLRLEGNTLLTTACDSIVVPGAGYSGNSPAGAAATAGTSWCYGTGIVYLLQGPILDPADQNAASRVDRDANITTWIAERPNAVLYSPCCVVAVHADLTANN